MAFSDDLTKAHLRNVSVEAANLEVAKHSLESAVRAARKAGATWLEIGKIWGITRQAAWEKFNHVED